MPIPRYRFTALSALLALLIAAPSLRSQYASPPVTYTLIENNSMFATGMTMKYYRDGSKALMEQTVPPQVAGYKGTHTRTLYDLQGQKQWTLDLLETDRPCGMATFTGDWGDPFAASAQMTSGLEQAKSKQIGSETLNGIATKVYEVQGPPGQGQAKVWIEAKYGLLIKYELTKPDGTKTLMLEVKQFSAAKPAAALFAKPAACAKAEAEAPVEIKTAHNVTAVHLDDPPNYTGSCPVKMHFTGTITTDGPGTVWFKVSAGVTGKEGEGEIKFTAAGTKKISKDLVVSTEPGGGGGSGLLEAAMEDEKGRHPDPTVNANNNFQYDCRGQAAAAPAPTPAPAPRAQPRRVAQAAAGGGKVTEMTHTAEPQHYTGACPGKITFSGTITTDGPARVPYVFHSSMKYGNGQEKKWTAEPLTFTEAGTQSVSKETTFVGDGSRINAWMNIGTGSPNPTHSKLVTFTVDCTGN